MTTSIPEKTSRSALRLASVFVALIVGVFVFWLVKRQSPAAARIFAPALAIFFMGYAIFYTLRRQRHLDEVQIASQRFANFNALIYGPMLAILLLMLPPVANWLVDLVNVQLNGPLDIAGRGAARLAFIYGTCLVVLMQTLIAMISATVWWRRMGGMRESRE